MEEEKTIEQQLEEAIQLANEYKKKYEELVHVCNQYEIVLLDFDRISESLITYFNSAVNGIRSSVKEETIRAKFKGEDFTKSKNIPVYIYRNEVIAHITDFIGHIWRSETRIYKKLRKLLERTYKGYTY